MACLAAAACATCPFQIVRQQTFRGSLEPGASAVHDVTVASEESLEIDLASSAAEVAGRRVDAWLVPSDCVQLFNEPYPTPSGALPPAQCSIIFGPVAPNSVSARQVTTPGLHRIILQAWVTNTAAADYDVELGTWGRTCRALPEIRRR